RHRRQPVQRGRPAGAAVSPGRMSGEPVAFKAPTLGPSAILSGPSALSNGNGLASITATANATPGRWRCGRAGVRARRGSGRLGESLAAHPVWAFARRKRLPVATHCGGLSLFAGPIIAREVLTAPRSARYYLGRAFFTCFLFIVMWTAWQSLIGWRAVTEF